MKLDKKTWVILWMLPVLYLIVVVGGAYLGKKHLPQPPKTETAEVETDDTTVADWIYQEPVNNNKNIEGDNMALAEAYEVSEAGSSEANTKFTKQTNAYFKAENNYSLSWDGDVWGIYDTDNFSLYENSTGSENSVPFSGWVVTDGASPAPTVTAVIPVPMPEAFQVTGSAYQDGKYTRESDTKYTLQAGVYLRYVYIDVADTNAWVITNKSTGDLQTEDDAFYVNFNAPSNDPTGSDYYSFLDDPEYNSPATVSIASATFELDDAEITADGNLKITWDIDNPPAAGSAGMTLSGGHTLGNWNHSGDVSTAEVTPPVIGSETGLKLSYDDDTGDFEDDEENALESFTDEPVTNNSTQKKKYAPIVWNAETGRMRRLREDEALDTEIDVPHQLPRVQTVGSAGEITPNAASFDAIHITALAASLELKNPTGGADGQRLLLRIKDNGTSRSLTWGGAYRGVMGNTLPSATDANATAYIGLIYNEAEGKWDLVAV